ncbi:hypothetical protein FM120_11415 [Sphingobacterium faecium PCAi_F2.5]|nr:hypothetical protein FM120_11415 [Sphingobacterium faecium PCAi_F2.5]
MDAAELKQALADDVKQNVLQLLVWIISLTILSANFSFLYAATLKSFLPIVDRIRFIHNLF